MDEETAMIANRAPSSTISFGDYFYSLVPEGASPPPRKVPVDERLVRNRVLDSLVSGEFYLGGEKQVFAVSNVEAYDLDSHPDADLIFFEVSPGANVYAGIVGVVDGQWVVVQDPSCH